MESNKRLTVTGKRILLVLNPESQNSSQNTITVTPLVYLNFAPSDDQELIYNTIFNFTFQPVNSHNLSPVKPFLVEPNGDTTGKVTGWLWGDPFQIEAKEKPDGAYTVSRTFQVGLHSDGIQNNGDLPFIGRHSGETLVLRKSLNSEVSYIPFGEKKKIRDTLGRAVINISSTVLGRPWDADIDLNGSL